MIDVRLAVPEDRQIIVDFQLRMARETEGMALDEPTVQKGVAAVFDDPNIGRYYIAHEAGKVLGSLLILSEWSDWRNGTVWWIHSVYVVPEARRRGVFKAMYAHLKRAVLASDGLRGLRLYVDRRNTGAQKVYESLGMDGRHYQMYEWMK
ncbi:MAG: N-acetyltransferase family protein [Phycisphaerae bacterium]